MVTRTPKIDRLTPEQEQALEAFRDEYLRVGLATGPADLEAVRPVIEKFYARIGRQPPVLVRCASPMAAHLAIHALKALRDMPGKTPDAHQSEAIHPGPLLSLCGSLNERLLSSLSHDLVDALWNATVRGMASNPGFNLQEALQEMLLDRDAQAASQEKFDNDQRSLTNNLFDNLCRELTGDLIAAIDDGLEKLWRDVQYTMSSELRLGLQDDVSNSIAGDISVLEDNLNTHLSRALAIGLAARFCEGLISGPHADLRDSLSSGLQDDLEDGPDAGVDLRLDLKMHLRHGLQTNVGDNLEKSLRARISTGLRDILRASAVRDGLDDAIQRSSRLDDTEVLETNLWDNLAHALRFILWDALGESLLAHIEGLLGNMQVSLADDLAHHNLQVDLSDDLSTDLRTSLYRLEDGIWVNLKESMESGPWTDVNVRLGRSLWNTLREGLGITLKACLDDQLGDLMHNLRGQQIALRSVLDKNLNGVLDNELYARLVFRLWGFLSNVIGTIDMSTRLEACLNDDLRDSMSLFGKPQGVVAPDVEDEGSITWERLDGDLKTELESNIRDHLDVAPRANLWGALLDEVLGRLWFDLESRLLASLRDYMKDHPVQYYHAWTWGSLEAFWIAYYLFPHQHLRPMHTDEQMDLLLAWDTLARNAGWMYAFDGVCFVCDRPEEIHQDDEGRLHNPDGMAVRFRDGWGLWAVHGVRVPAHVVRRQYTAKDIDDESNAEIRRVMIELYGADRYLRETNAQCVHRDAYGTLWYKPLPGDEDLYMVEVENATPEPDGTYRHYWLRIDPGAYWGDAGRIAHAAVASTWRDEDGELIFRDWRDYRPAFES